LPTDGRWFNNEIVQSDNTLPRWSDINAIVYSETPNLIIRIASKESLLAMKAISMFKRNRSKDIIDAQWLITNLKINSPNEVLDIVKKHWSKKQLENLYFDEAKAKKQYRQDIEFFIAKK
jgi:predicted nucleotidyltransferase component of viral defense system